MVLMKSAELLLADIVVIRTGDNLAIVAALHVLTPVDGEIVTPLAEERRGSSPVPADRGRALRWMAVEPCDRSPI